MSHDYAPLPSQEGTELRRRGAVAAGVGDGFTFYAVDGGAAAAGACSLRSILLRVSAAARSKYGVALLIVVLVAGAFVAYSSARLSLDAALQQKADNRVCCCTARAPHVVRAC